MTCCSDQKETGDRDWRMNRWSETPHGVTPTTLAEIDSRDPTVAMVIAELSTLGTVR